jgi:hypothetical protein
VKAFKLREEDKPSEIESSRQHIAQLQQAVANASDAAAAAMSDWQDSCEIVVGLAIVLSHYCCVSQVGTTGVSVP